MRLDPSTNSLTFDSSDELESFHAELSTLLREVTVMASSSSTDAAVATARAREVLERFASVAAMLNALRASGAVKRRAE